MCTGILNTALLVMLMDGKMFAVVAVLLAIFIGIVGMMLWLESRIRKLEKKSNYVED